MAKKAPRRTAERILEVTLDLFNRFGEPNVSTTLISAELRISPGNLYYHYPAKEELINSLFDRYEQSLRELLNASDGVRDVEHAWFFMHTLFELIWQYRFLYRDLNDLLSRNRRLETHFQELLKGKTRAVRTMLDSMASHGADQMMVQRYLCARSLAEARVALVLSGVVVLVQFTLFLLTFLAVGTLVAFALLSVRVIVNLVTLPVELDASFGKALPVLKQGGYLHEDDLPAARSVLRAAAFTYVASALISLINLARWIRLLR